MTRSKWIWMIASFLFATGTLVVAKAIAQTNTAQPVEIVNGKRQPVPTLEATEPYEDTCTINFNGSFAGQCALKSLPPRKRLIIQEFDEYLNIEAGLQPLIVQLQTSINHFFTLTFMSSDQSVSTYATHQETRLYAAAGSQPHCWIFLAGGVSNFGLANCQVSGFLVDVP